MGGCAALPARGGRTLENLMSYDIVLYGHNVLTGVLTGALGEILQLLKITQELLTDHFEFQFWLLVTFR